MTPTPITQAEVRRALSPDLQELDIRIFDELDSTNTYAKQLAIREAVSSPILIATRSQTAGRGRLGRSFHSPADTGLYMTLLYPTRTTLSDAVSITGAAAVAVVRAIKALTDHHPVVKWVNDIYLNNAKVGGILTEAITVPDRPTIYIAIGIGINLSTQSFPVGLRAPATSLISREGHAPHPAVLAAQITCELLAMLKCNPLPSDVITEYRSLTAWMKGKRVQCTQGTQSFWATIEDVHQDFTLCAYTDDGLHVSLSSGEVSLHLPTREK